jgi:hypothetical protein
MFVIPEIADLNRDDLLEARIRARAEIDRLNALGADASDEDLNALDSVLDHVDAIDARVGEIDTAAEERAARLEATRARVDALAEPTAETPVEEPIADPEPEAAAEPEPEPEAEVVAEPEAVLASGSKRPVVRAASKQAPAVIIPKENQEPKSVNSIVAAANVPEFNSGQELNGMDEVATAFLSRAASFGGSVPQDMKPGTYNLSPRAQRYGVARIKHEGREFSVDREMSLEAQFAAIMAASDENALSGNSVIAAGGWCAPSETIYDLFGYETNAGLLDLPEVTAKRGGIQFTKGPDFMTIFADTDAGFIQTETQAEAGTTKPCYALECPPFEEVRLDAIGFCATAPLLTNAAYPELTKRVLNLLGLGHQRRKSAESIKRIIADITTVYAWAPVAAAGSNSGYADVLGGLELNAMRIRQNLAMDPAATIEGFAPFWLKGALRTDVSRRLGIADPFNVPDSEIEAQLALRGIKLQFPYDYQPLVDGAKGTAGGTVTNTIWPTVAEVVLYPAGAYTRLVNDVISLDAVYDHDMLTGNEYTAAFVEEGFAIANTRGYGVRVGFQLNPNGASGYPAIGAPAAA